MRGRNEAADEHALLGARAIADALPRVLEDGANLAARRALLEGAMHAGAALAGAGLGLGHAMAQALGGRYGIAHGALNAICLPAALRFNEPVARDALARLGEAMHVGDPSARAQELARVAGYTRLRELGVPEADLDEVARATVKRAGAKANPRRATATEIRELLHSIW